MLGLQDNGEQSPSLTPTPTKKICHNLRDDDTVTMSLVEEDDERVTTEHKYHKREGGSDGEKIQLEKGVKYEDRQAEAGQEMYGKMSVDSKDDDDTEDEDNEGAMSSNNNTNVVKRNGVSTSNDISEASSLNSNSIPRSKELKSTPKSNPKKSRKLNYIPSKLGRKGDPRMHRALKARLDNPKLSLLDALTQGGFEFHWKDGISYDSDNVQLGQRKNQLSRRLRLYKQNQNLNKVEELEKRVNSASSQQNQNGASNDDGDNNINRDARKRKVPEGDSTGNGTYLHNPQTTPFFQFNRNDFNSSKDSYSEIMKMMMSQMSGSQPQCTFQPNNFNQSSFHYQNRHDFGNAMRGVHGRETAAVQHVPNVQQNQQQMNPFAPFVQNFAMNSSKFDKYSNSGAAEGSQGSASPSATQSPTDPLSTRNLDNYQQKINATMSHIQNDKIQKLNEALNLYRIDSSALMKRCMLSAGFTHQETEECDEMYVLFGEMAVEGEQKRIGRIRSKMSSGNQQQQQQRHPVMMPTPSPATMNRATGSPTVEAMLEMMNRLKNNGSFGTAVTRETPATTTTNAISNNANTVLAKRSSSTNSYSDSSNANGNDTNVSKTDGDVQKSSLQQRSFSNSTNHNHQDHSSSSSQSNSISTQEGVANKETTGPCMNQHVHRLEGRCGHRAIIHKPADGNPHIDFVVDGKVECYEHCQPLMADSTALWFSKFKCDKTHNCQNHDSQSVGGAEPKSKGGDKVGDCMTTVESNVGPKILDFNELNFESNEWKDILDVNEANPNNPFIDEEVLGSLFKLGEKN